MASLLRSVTAQSDPLGNLFMNTARARLLEVSIQQRGQTTPKEMRDLSVELLNAGRTSEAIEMLDRLETMAREKGTDPTSPIWIDIRMQQAVARLRQAEEANCTMHHNRRSCIFPIRGEGVHLMQEGSRAATVILSELLATNPDNLRARWLLNVAYMTLGEYPAKVPKRWLLAPDLFKSDYDIGSYPDVAGDLGLDVDDLAGGSIVDDFDGDGYLDIMVSAMGLNSQLRLFHSNADGTFTERTTEARLTGLVGGLNIEQTDFDNDGHPDVLVLRGGWMGSEGHYPNSLLHNNGDGTFTDVTEQAGVLSLHPTQTATWFDFDGDGWLDLFIGNESTKEDVNPNELYHNNRNGTFTECAEEAGVATPALVKGVASSDYNNDGRPDLYLSILGEPNRLYRNDGPAVGSTGTKGAPACAWKFTDVAVAAGVTEPIASFPTWFFDYDNDGWEDLFVSGYRVKDVGDVAADYLGLPHQGEPPRLYHNNGDGTFANVTQEAHLNHVLLTMGSNYGDLDNDGWLDFYAGTGNPDLGMLVPNRMFRNAGGRFFQDVTTSGGFGHLQKGHGVAFADLDNDGDEDVYAVVGGAYEADHFRNALFENPGHGNHWLTLQLEGVKANRPGIGARIKVVTREPYGGERMIYDTVRSGGSFGASPLRQQIGLRQADDIVSVEILWPGSGTRQVIQGLQMDHLYHVREGDSDAHPIQLRAFKLGRDKSSLAAKSAKSPAAKSGS
ncbi:MAG TPA: CRTAC1 family protein [Candidatus Polarisedimenticolia bacterium]|nr:CRTAC1 family protein [Candidatus Polarisedimenticolia bacterium]